MQSRSIAKVAMFVLGVMAMGARGDDTGFIQVKCDPGVQIFLDGNLKGVTTAEIGGLILQNIVVGRHDLKAVRPGFQAQAETVTVAAGQVVSVVVRPSVPQVAISETGEETEGEVKKRVGVLQIQSLPIECRLTIGALGVNSQGKKKDRWKADGVPVGKYTVVAEAMGKRLVQEVEVLENDTTELMLNFVSGEAKVTGATGQAGRGERSVSTGHGPVAGQPWTVPELTMELVWVAALNGWVTKYEVTNGEYRKYQADHDSKAYEGHPLNGDRQPVVYVSYDDAVGFAKWLTEREQVAGRLPGGTSYRLPTGDEWTVFAQCGDGREYPWGTTWPAKYGNYAGDETKSSLGFDGLAGYNDGHVVTCVVEQSAKNDWGLYGVGGNVWEWTSEQTNPIGSRMLRGASWGSTGQRLRGGVGRAASYCDDRIGFRLVLLR